MKRILDITNYGALLREIKERIHRAQYEALKAVNKELIALYWDIGRLIVGQQKRHGWGKSVVENLAKDLQLEFPGMHGFSSRNIWYIRTFFIVYSKDVKLQPLVAEIGWAHNVVIMERCKDTLEREFYIRMTRKFGWTKNILILETVEKPCLTRIHTDLLRIHTDSLDGKSVPIRFQSVYIRVKKHFFNALILQIDNKTYEKTLLNQTNFNKALPPKIHHQAKLAVKDEYTFDFLELAEEHNEFELERGLMERINRFLVEMGGVFTFMGNQFRLEIEGNEFFIDILLYHRHLKCLVAIELKTGKFIPEYAGKMQFYLAVLDDLVKTRGENPSIGIILCRDKNRTIVEYTLRDTRKPIGVATYRLTTKLPKDLKKEMPSPEQISELLREG